MRNDPSNVVGDSRGPSGYQSSVAGIDARVYRRAVSAMIMAARWARVLLAGWGCLAAAGIVTAADSVPRGPFAVWAIGLPNGYVVMEHQAVVIHVTAEDVAQGAIHVRNGSRFVITTGTATGYTVDFHAAGKLFRAVRVDGIGRAVEFGPAGGTVVQQDAVAGRQIISVSYRFVLAPDVSPGSYAWPLMMRVHGLVARDVDQPGDARPRGTVGMQGGG